ncbi:hybrid sensor histidine kinase/response regulator [Calothrix sp. PCC 6303]|uniref:hybrid sensor histidine kinase/response regulator n=1 Tax=Calothrix sp. PCC 6303 TaxID=1170562 RepID=UPI0002A0072C|nr:hybrid sensor histidine kinase/response regulator [Calothrix sp. PCC 6303]AFZ02492.1 multi-sensor hybrid histidine kinase [Calothrix sp. PCC 6303]
MKISPPFSKPTLPVKFGMNSIGIRLFLAVMTGAMVSLGGLGGLFYGELKTTRISQLHAETDIEARELDAALIKSEAYLKSLAAATTFVHLRGVRSPEKYEQLVQSFMAARPKLITGFGIMQLPYGLVDRQWFGPYIEETMPNRGTKLSADSRFSLVELWQTDKYPELQYYQDAVKVNDYFWSKPYLNPVYPIPLMTFSGPILDQNGRTIAIMNGDINLKDLEQSHDRSKLADSLGYSALIAQGGEILSYSLDPSLASKLAHVRSLPAINSVWGEIQSQLAQGQTKGFLEVNSTYFVYQQIPSSGWIEIHSIPVHAVVMPALQGALGATLMAAIFLAVTILLFMRSLNQRLQPILDACNETSIEPSEYQPAKDEIDHLSNVFFSMLKQQQQLVDQLQITNTELIESQQLKNNFLANMSHELRTPLNAILGMTEGLTEQVFGNVNDRQLKALATIERSGSHLLELINDILDVAKIESGHIELDFTPTSTTSLCQASLTFIKQQAHTKQITLETKFPPNLPDLMGDERRIRQVIINLLNNAVKFTPAGGRITLEVKNTRPSFLKISITDTGIGISPANIKKLFQPFIQIDSSLNRQYDGTGLGLALVKRIVELHGGSVGLTSEVGVGSCFSVELPCVDATAQVLQLQLESTTSADTLESGVCAVTSPLILLAEDNSANISTISSYLKAKGYRLVVANNGQEAIDLVQSARPDLVLMDIQMPGMDGFEAMQEIRSHPQFADLPIIALTALAMTGDREKCIAAGANDYISKPIKLKNLAQSIQIVLADRSANSLN